MKTVKTGLKAETCSAKGNTKQNKQLRCWPQTYENFEGSVQNIIGKRYCTE